MRPDPLLDDSGRHRGSGHDRHFRVKQVTLYATMAIATALSVLLVVGAGFEWWNFREFNQGLTRVAINKTSTSKPTHDIDGQEQNILIVGNDDRSGMTDQEVKDLHVGRVSTLSTDVMMIIHVPANGKNATLISLPRDSYVDIPDHGKNRLNSAYVTGYNAASGDEHAKQAAGANLLIDTIQNLTGLTIDHYVSIGFLGFYRIAKAINGLDVNLCAPVNDHQYSGFVAPKGKQHLSPVRVLQFVRQRHGFDDGDISRTKRQQYFLTAAFRKVASAGGILKLNDVFSAIKKSIIIDGTLDALKLGEQMQDLSANNIVSRTIPYNGFDNNSPVGSVVVVDPGEVKTFINNLIGTADPALTNAKTLAPTSVSVEVYNAGSGIDKAAQSAAEVLKAQGFKVPKYDDAPSTSATTIEYAAGMEAAAKTLQKYVPGATLTKTDVSSVRLLLGSDGLTAKPLPSKPTGSASKPSSASSSAKPKPTKPIDAGCIH